ncbi:MAG: 2-oxo acid dehydrogenase subunit E2 [Nevskia sp.]|nr:2-oxo acid dehydrogenase subunit E2 [Nevskia sp.]
MSEFRMPSLGADMDKATLVQWLVKPGDTVARGDLVAAVETDKGVFDIEIFESGTIEALKVGLDETVLVGTVLAIVRGAGEPAAAAVPEAPAAPAASPLPAATLPPPAPAIAPVPTTLQPRAKVTPAGRKRALELGVSLDKVSATGADGAVTLADVERAAAQARPGRTPGADMRSVIAASMSRSKREIPHYYLGTTVDMKPAIDWLAARNRERPITERLLLGVLLVKAVALALRDMPEFNGWWTEGAFRPSDRIHVGVAVSLRRGGLIAPALHDPGGMDLDTLMRAFNDLMARARGGHLRASEIADATITVTSLGERGVESIYPIIHPPQVAIVGFGSTVTRPWVAPEGAIEARPCVHASLAADHRVSDGHRGALFLAAIAGLLQQPEHL